MTKSAKSTRGTIGFRVKSGWAAAIVLAGPVESPYVLDRCIINLSDPKVPETKQPYHARAGTLEENRSKVQQRQNIVRRTTRNSVAALLRSYRDSGYSIRRAALVVGSDIDPAKIGNQHIRAHALEGRLFRTVLEEALHSHRIRIAVIVERNLYAKAKKLLHRSESALRHSLANMRPPMRGLWRAEEKSAALGAWMSHA